MNKYKRLEKMLGSKKCPDCGKTLDLDGDTAFCSCGFEVELSYKDRNRDKNKPTKKDWNRNRTNV